MSVFLLDDELAKAIVLMLAIFNFYFIAIYGSVSG